MMDRKNMVKLSDSDLNGIAGGAGIGYTPTASGSFVSNSGTKLNIQAAWTVSVGPGGDKTLDVTVSATSYSLTSASLETGVTLTVNGVAYPARSNAVNYQGNALAVSELASFSIPNFPGTASVTAVWHFNGTYSGVPVSDITASGTIAG